MEKRETDNGRAYWQNYDPQLPVNIMVIGKTVCEPGYFVQRKHSSISAFEYIESGSGFLQVNEKKYTPCAGCAVILIGHMNKAQGLKSGYRGLGSIDFRAAARSVLVVGRLKEDPTVRIVAQDKNSLAPEGKSIAFQLDEDHGFHWKGACDLSVDDVLSGGGKLQTKTTQMEEELERMLMEPVPAEAVLDRARDLGVSERTLMIAKKNLGVISEKRSNQWYWRLPEQGCKDVTG